MAVRPTRVRRLRIHRAIQATTFATSIALVGGVWFMAARTHVTLIVGGHAESISLGVSFGEHFGVVINAERSDVPSDVTLFDGGYSATRGATVVWQTIPRRSCG